MKKGIVIQARTGSSRLHNKILLPFYGQERIIDILIRNIKEGYPQLPVILATTTRAQDDVLADVARQSGIQCYRGEENNVLKRFIGAADEFGLDYIIRVCSDNPFLQVDTFATLFEEAETDLADYIAYGFSNGRPTIKSHLGLFSELASVAALRRIVELTQDMYYLEHVTNYMYTHEREFNIRLLSLPYYLEGRTDLRFTLDTPDDFVLLRELYAFWYERTDRTVKALLGLVESEPEYKERMLTNIAHNEK